MLLRVYKIQGARPRILNTPGDQWLRADFLSEHVPRAARLLSPVRFFPDFLPQPEYLQTPREPAKTQTQSRQAGPIRPKKDCEPPLCTAACCCMRASCPISLFCFSHPRDHIRQRHTCQKWHLPLASLVHT
jgi:hypothetical protein